MKGTQFLLCIFFFFHHLIPQEQKKIAEKYVAGASPGAGFFANVQENLNQIIWCEENNKVPVIYWNKTSLYYQENRGPNAWEYYFEPVSSLSYYPGDFINVGYTFEKPQRPYINFGCGPTFSNNFDPVLRNFFHTIITKYLKIKLHILKKVNQFYHDFMADKIVIGVHIRGTDKIEETTLVSPKKYIEVLKELQTGNDTFIFVATDEAIILHKMQQEFGDKVICYPAQRSPSQRCLHKLQGNNKALLGEEVLIDALLLSKCNLFIHSTSSVALAVLFFNPLLPHIFLKN